MIFMTWRAVEIVGILGIAAGSVLLVRYAFDKSDWMLSIGLFCLITGLLLCVVAVIWREQPTVKKED